MEDQDLVARPGRSTVFHGDDGGGPDGTVVIAAVGDVAKRNGFTVVSADKDFIRISKVEDITVENWWEPLVEFP